MVSAEVQEPVTDLAPRCKACDNVLMIMVSRPWVVDCYHKVKDKDGKSRRCKVRNASDDLGGISDVTAR